MHQELIIVDDDLNSCLRLEQQLHNISSSFTIGHCTNPKTALSKISSPHHNIVFLDVEMPQMSGFELLTALREKGYKGEVIFTTAFDQYVLKALREGAHDYLLKPIDPDELAKALKRLKSKSTKGEANFNKLKEQGLSKREVEISKLIFKGLSSKEIGEELFISKTTVDTHRRNILQKTGCKNTTELFTLL